MRGLSPFFPLGTQKDRAPVQVCWSWGGSAVHTRGSREEALLRFSGAFGTGGNHRLPIPGCSPWPSSR